MKRLTIITLCLLCAAFLQATKQFKLASPDGSLQAVVGIDKAITYSLSKDGQLLLDQCPISMTLGNGAKAFGFNSTLKGSLLQSVSTTIPAPFYKKAEVTDNYNLLTLRFREGFNLEFRLYDEGLAYRFVSTSAKGVRVMGEQAGFRFAKDWTARVPFVNAPDDKGLERQFRNSFEKTYTNTNISKLNDHHLIFLPILVKADHGVRINITESDLRDYPGMYLMHSQAGAALDAVFTPYPAEEKFGTGHNSLQEFITAYSDHLADAQPKASFPWRIISVSAKDKDLLDNDMVYRLAAPSKIDDTSWIKPGKVAWDWWNDFGIYNVPFKTGVNTPTYKAYIDFASEHGIEYVILDEGWAVKHANDLLKVVPEINLEEIVNYANGKNVGIILWAGCHPFNKDMEKVCSHYNKMGVKGFKIDFMDRCDAKMVNFHERAAQVCAKYHMLIDFHGTYKPTGLNRTYPNVLNFEGVAGLEQNKWSKAEDYDQVQYDTELPFIRMLAGQMDYTQGAMLNSTRNTYRPCNSEPMSQGTRCHQLGQYIIFFSPLNMLCDSPTHYNKEPECTEFIAKIPVVWDETKPLESKCGQYVAVARRKGSTWYVGGNTNWTARDITVDLSSIGAAGRKAEAFFDGPNADKFAQDYAKQTVTIPADGKLKVHMAPGGGFALKLQ